MLMKPFYKNWHYWRNVITFLTVLIIYTYLEFPHWYSCLALGIISLTFAASTYYAGASAAYIETSERFQEDKPEESNEREIYARFMAYCKAGKSYDEAVALTSKMYYILPSRVEAIIGCFI